jgi:HAMP domain-containing protein
LLARNQIEFFWCISSYPPSSLQERKAQEIGSSKSYQMTNFFRLLMLLILALFSLSLEADRQTSRRPGLRQRLRGRMRHSRRKPLAGDAPDADHLGKGFAHRRDLAQQREAVEERLAELQQKDPTNENEIGGLKAEIARLKEREDHLPPLRRSPPIHKPRKSTGFKILILVIIVGSLVVLTGCVVPLVQSKWQKRKPAAPVNLLPN